MTGQAVEGSLPHVQRGSWLPKTSMSAEALSYLILSSEACKIGLRNSTDKSHPRNQKKKFKMCLEVAYINKKTQLLSPYYLYISCNWKYKYKTSLYSFSAQGVVLTQKLILRVSCTQPACQ